MRRVATMLATAAMVLTVVGVYAQGKDFSGKWTPDTEKNAAANAGGGGGGRGGGGGAGGGDMTIAQDAKTLKITRTGPNGDTTTTYNLDGSETTVPMGRGGEGKATAKWDGAKLVITVTGGQMPQVTTYYMEGANLVSERAGQNGPQKTYYKKAS